MTTKRPYYIGLAGSAGARSATIARDGMHCRYCGIAVRFGVNFSLDHVIPASMNGRTHLANLVVCCHDCNKKKGSMSLADANMRLLPVPKHSAEDVAKWEATARRKCCAHCGYTYKAHHRDTSRPHGEQLRCRDTGKRFCPRDAPIETLIRLGVDISSIAMVCSRNG